MKILFVSLLYSCLCLSSHAMEKYFVSDSPINKSVLKQEITKNDSDKAILPLADMKRDLKLKPHIDLLIGKDVVLRPVFPEDYVYFIPVFTNETVMKYFGDGKILNPVEVQERTHRHAKNLLRYYGEDKTHSLLHASERTPNGEFYSWTIITHRGIAGRVTIKIPEEKGLMPDLSYCIAPSFGGKGLTTEASSLVLHDIPGNFEATVHPENIGSIKVLEKLGFKPDISRQNIKKFGNIRNYYILWRTSQKQTD